MIWALIVLGALPLALAAYMYSNALRDPVVRLATIEMPDWPKNAPPLRVALLSDIHVVGPDMPPSRLARIVPQVNALNADVILLAGDYVSDKRSATRTYSATEGLASLSNLRAPRGVYAVLGNHDHWRDAGEISGALRKANIRILDNEAVTAGGMRLGGLDDDYTGNSDLKGTVAEMRSGPGGKVLLSHSPDVGPATPQDVTLILAGHTHCGQIQLPIFGAISYVSKYGERFGCGVITEGARRVVVTAGIGTSILPFRLGAPSDVWLLTLESAEKPGDVRAQRVDRIAAFHHHHRR
jgi:predicted MPP superfamily phosphohydrolase